MYPYMPLIYSYPSRTWKRYMLCLYSSGINWYDMSLGWFPLSRNFSVRTHLKLTCLNETDAMYERPSVNVKVEQGSTFTYTHDLLYIVSIFFTPVRLKKLHDSGNPPFFYPNTGSGGFLKVSIVISVNVQNWVTVSNFNTVCNVLRSGFCLNGYNYGIAHNWPGQAPCLT